MGISTDLVGIPQENPGPAFGHRRSSLRQRHGLPLLKKVSYNLRVRVRVVEFIIPVNDRIAQESSFHVLLHGATERESRWNGRDF